MLSVLCRVCHVFPPLVSIFGLFPVLADVIISLFLSSRVCLIVYDYPLYISPVFWVWFRLVYLWLPGVSCLSALSCPALMSWLKTIIWVYVLVCVFLFLPRVCTVTEDQTKYSKRRPFTSFCFLFFEKFFFVPQFCVCPAAWKSPLVIPAIAHCKSAWEVGGIAASAASHLASLAASPHARRSREISALPAVALPLPAGFLVPGLPLPQARRSREITPPDRCWLNARLWLYARRSASDSMPAGSPLTQARQIAADSSPPDRRWLMPAGRRYP